MSTAVEEIDDDTATAPDGALFVAADEPLLIFPSVAAAERSLEAIDVENGVYPAAYGPKGEPYRISCAGNRVVIERTGEPNKPDELNVLLLRYLDAVGQPMDESRPLGELVAIAWSADRAFWQEHDPFGDRFARRIPPWGCVALVLLLAVALYVAFG